MILLFEFRNKGHFYIQVCARLPGCQDFIPKSSNECWRQYVTHKKVVSVVTILPVVVLVLLFKETFLKWMVPSDQNHSSPYVHRSQVISRYSVVTVGCCCCGLGCCCCCFCRSGCCIICTIVNFSVRCHCCCRCCGAAGCNRVTSFKIDKIWRLNLTAAQVSNPLLSALCCLHEGCLEGEPAVQCIPLLVEKAGCSTRSDPYVHHAQASIQAREPPWLLKPMGRITQNPKYGQWMAPQNGP